MNKAVIVIGAGGHAQVIAEALMASGVSVLGFTDSAPQLLGSRRTGLPVLGGDEVLSQFKPDQVLLANGLGFVTGSGRYAARRKVQHHLEGQGWTFTRVIHPLACVSRHAVLAPGAQVMAHAVIQTGTQVEAGAIVNTAAIVEHGSAVGAWAHVATRATLCGDVRIGEGCLIGAGAVIKQGVSLCADTVVGAGAVVLRDCVNPATLCGVPARPLGS